MGKTNHSHRTTYVADFETGKTDENECFVWLWCYMNLDGKSRQYGSGIESFIESISARKNTNTQTYYFHNLKYDGTYIASYLLKNGFTISQDRNLQINQFSILVSKGQWYQIRIRFPKCTIRIQDSLKLMPMPVSAIGKLVGYPKGDLGEHYNITDEKYQATNDDIEYCFRDCDIVRMGLLEMFNMKVDRLTIASSSMTDCRRGLTNHQWAEFFPDITDEQDEDIRKAYVGGWCYVNPDIQGQVVGRGGVIDVNSLYPSVMHDCPLPCGQPMSLHSTLVPDSYLAVYHIQATFRLKRGYLPTLMRKQGRFSKKVEYYENGTNLDLWITSIDFNLMTEHYDMTYKFLGGYAFRTLPDDNPIRRYIDRWIQVKIDATERGDKITRQIAKLMLNSCYGKFGSKRHGFTDSIALGDKGQIINQRLPEITELKHYYLPVAVFCTSWARNKTIRTAQKIHSLGKFCYSDTDSIHFTELSVQDLLDLGIDVHPTNLGSWDYETEFIHAKFLRQKCYIEETTNGMSVHICGCPSTCNGVPVSQIVTFDNFKDGLTIDGKLITKSMSGGTYLQPTQFTLK